MSKKYPVALIRSKCALLTIGALLASPSVYAERFADDFSSPSLRYYTNTFDDSSGVYSVDVLESSLRMSSGAIGDARGNINLHTVEDTDSYQVKFTLSSESVLEAGEDYSSSTVFIEGYFYNDTYDDDNRAVVEREEGDVWVSLNMGVDQNGSIGASYCLSRNNSEGQLDNLEEFGTETCNQLAGSDALQLDTQYDASINIDRSSSTLTIKLGNLEKEISLSSSNVYKPIRKNQRFQVWQNGVPGVAVAYVHAVGADGFYQDFSTEKPIIDRYSNFDNSDTRSTKQVNQQLVLSARGQPNDGEGNSINVNGNEGYIETEFLLSSESTMGSDDGGVNIYLQYFLYNDIQDGGTEGRLGDVRAQLYASKRADGRNFMEYCLRRADDADNDARSGLLEGGRNCDDLPIAYEYDKTYRASIALDKEMSLVRFRVDGHVVEVPVSTSMFVASDPEIRLGVDARNDSYVIAQFDNVRTHADELTLTESNNGLTQTPAFPEPIDPASLQVDSNLPNLYDILDYSSQVSFLDDFSTDVHQLGLSTGRDRGQMGVSWADGALVLESNSFPDNDDGNWSEFYINHQTDSIETVVALSSDSRLPPDGDAEALIQIRAVFYNDTQDYGFNGQEGDMEAVIAIRYRGDGRRQVRIDLRRRDENGRTQDDLFDDLDEVRSGIESIVPELDTEYRIGIALDKENSLLKFFVDDEVFDYAIPTGVFLQTRLRTLVSVNHRGSSGIAVGKVYSIKTDRMDESYRLVAPLLAPYSPQWNSFYPGRSADIVDGRLKLTADGTLTSGRDPGIEVLKASDYVGASLELSSESQIGADGEVHVQLHSIMYNDLDGGEQDGSNEGRVFSNIRLVAKDVGIPHVEYCISRSNTSDFSETTQLLGNDPEECPRFTIEPSLDSAYPAFIKLDRALATLTFGFGGETFVYNIPTSIGNSRPFNGVRARTSDNSKVVAWVDDLAFSETPLPLDQSADALIRNDGELSASGSGCSIASSGDFDPMLPALAFLSLGYMGFARRRA